MNNPVHSHIIFMLLTCGLCTACSNEPPLQHTQLKIDLKKENMHFENTIRTPKHYNYALYPYYSHSVIYGHPTSTHLSTYSHPWVFSTGYQDPRWQPNLTHGHTAVSSNYRLDELLLLLKTIGQLSPNTTLSNASLGDQGANPPNTNEYDLPRAPIARQKSCEQKNTHQWDQRSVTGTKKKCVDSVNNNLARLLNTYSSLNHFDSNSSVVKVNRSHSIDQLARFIATEDHLQIEIRGHTDSTASDTHNHRLSIMRAKSIADKFLEHGVASAQLSLFGYGKTKPLCSNSNTIGKAINRRTEIVIHGLSSDNFASSCNSHPSYLPR